MINRRDLVILAGSSAFYGNVLANGKGFPEKPIKIIVPLPPGGSNDVLARVIASKMAESMGQPVVVENKPGAAGNIATDIISKSPGDGYTLGIAPNQTVAVNPVLYEKLPFNVSADLQGVSMLGRVPVVLVVSEKIKSKTVGELINLAKSSVNPLTYASAGAGSPQHMSAEIFKSMAGVQLTHIPYKGSAAALIDVLAGNIDIMFCPINSALPHIRSGKLRALATTGRQRVALLDGIPTIGESLPGYESDIWIGMVTSSKADKAIIEKLNSEIVGILKMPDVVDKLSEQGIYAESSTAKEFTDLMMADQKKWAEVIKLSNIKPD